MEICWKITLMNVSRASPCDVLACRCFSATNPPNDVARRARARTRPLHGFNKLHNYNIHERRIDIATATALQAPRSTQTTITYTKDPSNSYHRPAIPTRPRSGLQSIDQAAIMAARMQQGGRPSGARFAQFKLVLLGMMDRRNTAGAQD